MITKKAKGEMLKTQQSATFPYLIHIHNDDLGDFYYANYYKDVVYNGQNYLRSCFKIDPPDKTQDKIGNASFSFSVADQVWIDKIRSTEKRSTIEFVAVIIYDDDTIEPVEENNFVLTSAQWDESVVTWQMIFDENMDILTPCDIVSGLNCAGCV